MKIDKLLEKPRNVYLFALIAILIESFSSVCLKLAGEFPVFSKNYVLYYFGALIIMGIYAVLWQLLLEHLPLTTAYLRKGVTYILLYLWAYIFFGEHISLMQWVGTAIILAGMVVSQMGEGKEKGK
ncbi:MAG: transporter [Eubacterium sp.]|nr:transporter [Eubacterium sp.]